MYDISNIYMWKFKMSAYLKVLGLHIYLVTIKKSYFGNDKYLRANAQAIDALKQTLNKERLFIVSHCDSDFVMWNTLTSYELQTTNYVEKESSGDESDQTCFMVQGIDSLKIKSDTHLWLC